MIPVDRLTARAVRILRLQSHPDYDVVDALSALAELLVEDGLMTTDLMNSEIVTTVADQSEYPLGEHIARIQEIVWPSDWTGYLDFVTPNAIKTIRQELAGDAIASSTSQPIWYTYFQKQDGSHVLALEEAASIAVGLTITVHFDRIDGAEITRSSNLNLPVTMFPFLRAGLCMNLARQYDQKRIAEFTAEHLRLREEWNRRNTYPTNETVFRPYKPF